MMMEMVVEESGMQEEEMHRICDCTNLVECDWKERERVKEFSEEKSD